MKEKIKLDAWYLIAYHWRRKLKRLRKKKPVKKADDSKQSNIRSYVDGKAGVRRNRYVKSETTRFNNSRSGVSKASSNSNAKSKVIRSSREGTADDPNNPNRLNSSSVSVSQSLGGSKPTSKSGIQGSKPQSKQGLQNATEEALMQVS